MRDPPAVMNENRIREVLADEMEKLRNGQKTPAEVNTTVIALQKEIQRARRHLLKHTQGGAP